jgi:pimeloyl-ACP methyl ester carboxylesterase
MSPLRLTAAILSVLTIACAPANELAPQPTRETGFVTMNDGARIYYERTGTGPAMLFLHGLAGNHAAWFQQVPYFARSHRVITIAQRGFAPSTANRDEYDNGRLVADAIAVLETLGERNVAIVGQSMGGWTALGVALERPDLVHAVVLSATVGGIFDDEIARHYEGVIARARDLASKPPALGAHPALGRRFAKEQPDNAYLYQLLTSFGSPPPGTVAEGLGRTRFDDAMFARLRAPVLFVVGEDDEIFPPRIVERAAARVPGAQLALLEGVGHSPYFERPDAWNRVIADFLRR